MNNTPFKPQSTMTFQLGERKQEDAVKSSEQPTAVLPSLKAKFIDDNFYFPPVKKNSLTLVRRDPKSQYDCDDNGDDDSANADNKDNDDDEEVLVVSDAYKQEISIKSSRKEVKRWNKYNS